MKSSRLQELQARIAADMPNAENDFFSTLVTPIVEPIEGNENGKLVTFIWRGNNTTARVVVTGGRPSTEWEKPLERMPGTQLWFLSEVLPSDSRFVYWIRVNSPETGDLVEDLLNAPDAICDPFNPNELTHDDSAGGSYVVLPNSLPFPYKSVSAGASQGQLIKESIGSAILGSSISLNVYLPPKESLQGTLPWVAIAFDEGFRDMAAVLDDLITLLRLPPLVFVGVADRKVNGKSMRTTDLGYSVEFAEFVVDELLPWVRNRYQTSSSRQQAIIAGVSRGAGMATYIALHHPEAFANVLSISTAIENEPGGYPPTRFWLRGDDGWIIERVLEKPTLALRFFLAVGRFDTSLWTDRLVNNRRLRDSLRGKGYPVIYCERNGGHDELFFQLGFTEGLVALTSTR